MKTEPDLITEQKTGIISNFVVLQSQKINMKFTKTVAAAMLLISLSFLLKGQGQMPDTSSHPYWIDMMQDPEANFYDVQSAFYTYWEGREIERSSGYKPFKRWEYRMQQSRIRPDGTRIPASQYYNEYFRFTGNNSTVRSQSGTWAPLGPVVLPQSGREYKGLGRLNAIAFHPTDPDILYVGSPSGGLWRTTVGGNEWEPLTDDQPTLGVSAIIVDYSDPDVLYLGTGDRDAGDAFGIGVFRSTDAGETWTLWNNGMGEKTVGRMIQHPADPLTLIAATNGGVYKTIDGGLNWYQTATGNFKEILFKPFAPDVIYAAAGANFYKSVDGGENFSQVTSGLPSGSRGVIAVTPAAPDYVYFLITTDNEYKGIYRSTNSGSSFTERSTSPNIMSWGCNGGSGGQAWYDLDVAVDPYDADVIFAGGVNCFKSGNGGLTWNISSHWWGDCGVPAVHADLHILEYNPVNNILYAGNDGGIYYTSDRGISWNLISNGLVISQVYKIGQSASSRDKCLNGYQDNGTSTYMGSYWQFTRGGDGMECAVDPEDDNYSYATVYYGNIDRYYQNSFDADVASNGNFGLDETGAWITPFIIDEENSNTMFVGYKNVWRCDNIKAPQSQVQWTKISSDLAGNNSENMRVLEQSPADPEILYAARYDNRLFRTDNSRENSPGWINLTSYLPESGGINDIECHPSLPDVVWLSQNNQIFRSADRGITWENVSINLPDVAYTSIAYYERGHEAIYVSSDIGVFFKDQFMTEWVMFSDGLPVDASISEIEIYYETGDAGADIIRAGTYGRGMWESDMYRYTPVAGFTASDTLIPPGCSIDFTDRSEGLPESWNWTFTGAVPATSGEQSPSGIVYNEEGTYEVKLIVSNEAGIDSVIFTDYIHVSTEVLPEVGFSASETNSCTNTLVYFTDETGFCPHSWLWEVDPPNVYFREGTGPESQDPVIEFRNAGSYSVTLTAVNSNGSSSLTKSDYMFIGGAALPFSEDFSSGSLEADGWTVENPDYSFTWQDYLIEETGNHTARMKFYGYFGMEQRDKLISPILNFDGMEQVYLSFRYAYAQRFSQVDSLIVYISDNCGDQWTRIWEGGPDGTGIFATSLPTPYEFIPLTDDEWCGQGYGASCVSIDVSQYAGDPNMQVMFEAFNNLGNNLYLDDILVSNTTGTDELVAEDEGLHIRPNPNRGSFTLITGKLEANAEVRVMNLQGKIVFRRFVDSSEASLQLPVHLDGQPAGFYIVTLREGNSLKTGKLIIR